MILLLSAPESIWMILLVSQFCSIHIPLMVFWFAEDLILRAPPLFPSLPRQMMVLAFELSEISTPNSEAPLTTIPLKVFRFAWLVSETPILLVTRNGISADETVRLLKLMYWLSSITATRSKPFLALICSTFPRVFRLIITAVPA